jgi:hypothetical protein
MKTTAINGPAVQVADGTIYNCTAIILKAEVKIGPYRGKTSYYVLPLNGNDAILGAPWLTTTNPRIDWRTKTITIRQGGHEVRLQPERPPSTQRDGELTTLTALQANKELRRGATPMLAFIRPASSHVSDAGDNDHLERGTWEIPGIQTESKKCCGALGERERVKKKFHGASGYDGNDDQAYREGCINVKG